MGRETKQPGLPRCPAGNRLRCSCRDQQQGSTPKHTRRSGRAQSAPRTSQPILHPPKGSFGSWRSKDQKIFDDANRVAGARNPGERHVDNRLHPDSSPRSGEAPELNRCGWSGPLAYNVLCCTQKRREQRRLRCVSTQPRRTCCYALATGTRDVLVDESSCRSVSLRGDHAPNAGLPPPRSRVMSEAAQKDDRWSILP